VRIIKGIFSFFIVVQIHMDFTNVQKKKTATFVVLYMRIFHKVN